MNSAITNSPFEELYLKVRGKEKRLYPDELVAALPFLEKNHLHINEWKVRKTSFEKFKKYLEKKNRPLNILDLGCGNGWMSNRMTAINESTVTGCDLNHYEIEQAKRVFAGNSRLKFETGDLFSENNFTNERFDIIVLASSVQYFKDLGQLIRRLTRLLKPSGEIHIIDSPFYFESTIAKAKESSRQYYHALGCEEMTAYYHHHLWSELSGFHFKIYSRPFFNKWLLKLFSIHKDYFPWIVIFQS